MKIRARFYLVGLAVAFLEEFITQGILKRNLAGWIIPTFIAGLEFEKRDQVRWLRHLLELRYLEERC
jgi:hypothetical protein